MIVHPQLDAFCTQLPKASRWLIEEKRASAKALLIKLIYERTQSPVLLITDQEELLMRNLHAWQLPEVLSFPAWETLPSENVPPSPDIVGRRFNTLKKIKSNPYSCIVTPLQAVLQKTLDPDFLSLLLIELKTGEQLCLDAFVKQLEELGYTRVLLAREKGEFALRGGIVDLFATNAPTPYRVEFCGDLIESIRMYDAISQKSVKSLPSVTIVGAKESEWLGQAPNSTLLDYLSKECWIILDDLLALEDRYLALKKMPGAICASFMSFEQFFQKITPFPQCFFSSQPIEQLSEVERIGDAISFEFLHQKLRAKRWMSPFCEPVGITGALQIIPHLSEGFALLEPDLIIASEPGAHKHWVPDHQRISYHSEMPETFALEPGDLVVHYQHGIGKYLGLEKKPNYQGVESEFLLLEYQEGAKLYVPVQQAHLINKYIGVDEEMPTIHALNSQRWKQMRSKSEAAIQGYAQDLLRLYAERSHLQGFDFGPDGSDLQAFENGFSFQETEDQLAAIALVKEEMHSTKCMDRLVCGDVGYGKTEVAMRAAFKAVSDGKKQVAVLVPTTLLAQQHFETFCERMKGFNIRIEALSRLQGTKKSREILKNLLEGTVDILIGTHRLLSNDVQFKELGLVVIDEEQRFGVKAKEGLKKFVANVDCLTLSATPIPRTLYMSIVGVKDLSAINTPPYDRLPIKSVLTQTDDAIFQQGLMRELARGGQAFIIHNRIESLYTLKDYLQTLVPSAKFCIAHGQMDPEAIEGVFHAFQKKEADVLLATTLVENGIDIPNANTIFIDRADQFGLANLYQLRGRVGRWNRRAYCYFLVSNLATLPTPSQKRLQALVENSGYGGGLRIAMRDLELRGAGNLLGTEQSGHVEAIGFPLYCKLLKRSVDQLHGKTPIAMVEARVEFEITAKLDECYVPSSTLRLEFYQRLGEATALEQIDLIFEEIRDRFGPLPRHAHWLHALSRLRLFAALNQIQSIRQTKNSLTIERQVNNTTQTKSWLLPAPKEPSDFETKILPLLKEFCNYSA